MAGLVSAIHVFYVAPCIKTWARHTRLVPGPAGGRTRVPGMTTSMPVPSFMQIALEEARAAGARGEVLSWELALTHGRNRLVGNGPLPESMLVQRRSQV